MPLAEFQQTTLRECMQQPGCPLCRAVWTMDAARFGWYVNDGVLDEETQRQKARGILRRLSVNTLVQRNMSHHFLIS